MVLIQKGGLLFLIGEGFLRQIQGQERTINKGCTKHTRPWKQETFMEVYERKFPGVSLIYLDFWLHVWSVSSVLKWQHAI